MNDNNKNSYSTYRRNLFAKWLMVISWSGFALMALAFFLYAFEVLNPRLGPKEMSFYWRLPAADYREAMGLTGGTWQWLFLAHKPDYMILLGISLMVGSTLVCNIRLLPILIREHDIKLALICLGHIIVILLALLL